MTETGDYMKLGTPVFVKVIVSDLVLGPYGPYRHIYFVKTEDRVTGKLVTKVIVLDEHYQQFHKLSTCRPCGGTGMIAHVVRRGDDKDVEHDYCDCCEGSGAEHSKPGTYLHLPDDLSEPDRGECGHQGTAECIEWMENAGDCIIVSEDLGNGLVSGTACQHYPKRRGG